MRERELKSKQLISACRVTMLLYLPVLNAMFKGQFNERSANEIVLQHMSVDFREFLKSFYPTKKHTITGKKWLL